MIGRFLLGVAAVGCLSAAPARASAQAAHRYVAIATVVLPEPGDPLAVVFADTGAMSKTPDGAAIDVVYALGRPLSVDSKDTSHVVFQFAIACAPKTLALKRYVTYSAAGQASTVESAQPAHPAGDAVDENLLKLACQPAAATGGYATMDQVLAHAHDFVRSKAESEAARKHNFLFIGAAPGSALGPFAVFVDAASLERAGDRVTAQVLEVFQPPANAGPTALAYALNTTTYVCAAKTQTSDFVVTYQADGTPLHSRLTGASAKPVNPGTIDERAMDLACTNGESAKGSSSLPSIETAVAAALHPVTALAK